MGQSPPARQGGLKTNKDEAEVQFSSAHFPAHPVLMPFELKSYFVYFCHLHFVPVQLHMNL